MQTELDFTRADLLYFTIIYEKLLTMYIGSSSICSSWSDHQWSIQAAYKAWLSCSVWIVSSHPVAAWDNTGFHKTLNLSRAKVHRYLVIFCDTWTAPKWTASSSLSYQLSFLKKWTELTLSECWNNNWPLLALYILLDLLAVDWDWKWNTHNGHN